jgi:hypothetical protein
MLEWGVHINKLHDTLSRRNKYKATLICTCVCYLLLTMNQSKHSTYIIKCIFEANTVKLVIWFSNLSIIYNYVS